MNETKIFSYIAHSFKTEGPLTNGDHKTTYHIESAEQLNLAPHLLIPFGSRLKITVEILES